MPDGVKIEMKKNPKRYISYIGLLWMILVLVSGCTGQEEQEMPFTEVTGQPEVTETGTPLLPETGKPDGDITTEEDKTEEFTEASTPTSTPTSIPTSTPTSIPTPVITDPYDGKYWTGRYTEDVLIQMTKEQIQEQNARNFAALGTKLVKLSDVAEYSIAEVVSLIENYSLPSRRYFDDHEITAMDKEELLQARNLSALWNTASDSVIPEYGILVKNTDVRSFPTEKRLTSQIQGRFDYLQETRLLISEPVLVLHRSKDGTWCFVQAENYCGWIRDEAVAYCSKDELCTMADAMASVESDRIVVVTKNGNYPIGERELYLRMGTRLLRSNSDRQDEEAGQAETVKIRIPCRDEKGNLVWEEANVKSTDTEGEVCFAVGYLPCTRANIIKLAVRLLGMPYAWGDAPSFGEDVARVGDNGMDCSSTVAAVFRCFGVILPRNTGTQRKMDCVKQEMSDLGMGERRELLDGLQGGELLYTSGHVMLYLGKADGEYYVLHNTSTESRDDGGSEEFYRCVITTMGLGKTGQTILERLIQVNDMLC